MLRLEPKSAGEYGQFSAIFRPDSPVVFTTDPDTSPQFSGTRTLLSYNPLTTARAEGVATSGFFDADCQLTAQSSTCDYVFPAWEKRVCAWSVNVF